MSKVQQPKVPSVLEVLTARVAHLEDKIEALFSLQNPVTFAGKAIARCTCNALVTQTVTVDHPIHGIRSQGLCDACPPSGYVATLCESAPPGRVTFKPESDEKVLEFARRINSFLSFRQ